MSNEFIINSFTMQGPAGPGIVWKGAYSSIITYNIGDGASYNGSSYICIKLSLDNLPTDTEYWELIAEGGAISGDIDGGTF